MKSTSAAVPAPPLHVPRATSRRVSTRYTIVDSSRAAFPQHTDDVGAPVHAIADLPLFSCLTDDELALVSRVTEHRSYLEGRPILLPGESGDGLYIVLAGQVKVLIEDAPGRELVLDTLGAGEIFGEVALFDRRPHSGMFDAHTDCEVLFIPAAAFWEHAARNADALHMILAVMARRRRYADHTIHRLAFMDVYARVVTTLLEDLPEQTGEWFLGSECQQISKKVGATREMVNRVIRDMIGRGAVKRHARRMLIVNRTSLCELCRSMNVTCPLLKGCCMARVNTLAAA